MLYQSSNSRSVVWRLTDDCVGFLDIVGFLQDDCYVRMLDTEELVCANVLKDV